VLGGALAVQTIDGSENARIDRHGLSPRTRSDGLAFGDGQVGATVTGYSDWGTRAAPVNSSCLVTTLAAASV
jgi:hypothetical protein